jgi:hypothetical protein
VVGCGEVSKVLFYIIKLAELGEGRMDTSFCSLKLSSSLLSV